MSDVFGGEAITVACVECQTNCGGVCAPGTLWLPDERRCVKREICGDGLMKEFNEDT